MSVERDVDPAVARAALEVQRLSQELCDALRAEDDERASTLTALRADALATLKRRVEEAGLPGPSTILSLRSLDHELHRVAAERMSGFRTELERIRRVRVDLDRHAVAGAPRFVSRRV